MQKFKTKFSNLLIHFGVQPFGKDSTRSSKAKGNILFLFIFNGFNFVFNLLIVRLTLDYLGKTEYGVWLTLSSILTWFNYLDFGLGNGLRNKLAEALAKNDIKSAKIYVYITGGNAQQITPHLKIKYKFVSELVLIGIKAVYEKNA